jgi:para-nitrobenzyl esterase
VAGELVATLGTMPFHPAVDGTTVTSRPRDAMARGDVELLIGTTADELNTYLDPAAPTLERERLVKRTARYLGGLGVTDPDAVLSAYDELASPADVWAALRTDGEMWLPAVEIAERHGDAGPATFMYRFDWPAAPPNAHLGACHAIDIPFTFGTFDREGWDRFVGFDGDADRLGHALREAWIAFASSGDPSTPLLGRWPRYSSTSRATMLLGRRQDLASDPRAHVRKVWESARARTLRP